MYFEQLNAHEGNKRYVIQIYFGANIILEIDYASKIA